MEEYNEENFLKGLSAWFILGGSIWIIPSFLLKLYTPLGLEVIVPICALVTVSILAGIKYVSKSKEASFYKQKSRLLEEQIKGKSYAQEK